MSFNLPMYYEVTLWTYGFSFLFTRPRNQPGQQDGGVPTPDHIYNSRFSTAGLAYNANYDTVQGVPTGGAEGGVKQERPKSENPYATPNDMAFSQLQSKGDKAGYDNPAYMGANPPPAYSIRPLSTSSDVYLQPDTNTLLK